MKIGILQLNFTVGDFEGNTQKIINGYNELSQQGAELVVGSELAIFGYPPKDMLERQNYVDKQMESLAIIREQIGEVALLLGVARPNEAEGKSLFNSVAFIHNNSVSFTDKFLLPNYDVFDEQRYFEPGTGSPPIIEYRGKKIAVLVCEDIWNTLSHGRDKHLYKTSPVDQLTDKDCDILVTVNASPYYWGKGDIRTKLISGIAKKLKAPVVYVNQVGGNDDLVFDGRSLAVDNHGNCITEAKAFEEDLSLIDIAGRGQHNTCSDTENFSDLEKAIVLGTRDYITKTKHKGVLVALSGGIDSALVLKIAVDAVGAEKVLAIGMPSPFSSGGSVDDARALAETLGVKYEVIRIDDVYTTLGATLEPHIGWNTPGEIEGDVTEENIQARIRGTIIMAHANRLGYIPLTTGNKSETAVGYCTLYGDTAGGFAPLSDIYKTDLYKLAEFMNREGIIIPENTLYKPPSAELGPDQKDEDSLPPYDILDPILELYIEEQKSVDEIAAQGYDRKIVEDVIRLIHRNEFKRNQMPPGLRLTGKAFGSGRRWPIVARYL